MRVSLFVSILFHVVLLWALLTLFNIVPEMRLPQTVYHVRITQPPAAVRQEPQPAPQEEERRVEVAVEQPKEVVPKPKPKPKPEPPKKVEPPKKPPAQEPQPEKQLDVSVQQSEQTRIAVEGPQFPFAYYLTAVERRVSENWFSPSGALGEGFSCVVYFRLGRGGQVSDLRIETSSGNAHFDRSALRAIRSAEPFPPLPRAFGEAWLGIHFTFIQRR